VAIKRGIPLNRPLLNDKNEYPDDDVVTRHLGKAKPLWDMFVARLRADFGAMNLTWKFYNDGKAWLGKVALRQKTMCWISVWDNFFKITFYFTDKNSADIASLKIDRSYKDAYSANGSSGKLKPLSIEVKSKRALLNVFEVLSYKSAWKG
jgi:hypothetical protein